MAHQHHSINYIELPLVDLAATQAFYSSLFGWEFQQWGDGYLSFSGAGIEGGFNGVDSIPVAKPGVLVILFSNDLEASLAAVKAAGGTILQEIYAFPGGRRFHFADPNGNELAIWAEAD
ncbi:VOC family protein [Cognatishimia sp. SS12]|uniref:VOC family protein n=1 Tax=Cognatishimia sp. SS12 TaxID=2979465 RepID=UPI002330D7B1|nr:VOC family protein [Cognatishimia sp. SS12]MDC0738282.1 VOC family protein [Cognatishimia sp. SS12]